MVAYLTLGSKVIRSSVATVIATNLIFHMLASVSLNFLWGFVNSLQLIANLPLMSLNMPANLFFTMALISGPLEFNFWDTNESTASVLGVDPEDRPYYI